MSKTKSTATLLAWTPILCAFSGLGKNRISNKLREALFSLWYLIPFVAPAAASTGLDWDGTGSERRMLYWSDPFPMYDATYFFKVYQRQQVTGVGDGSRYYVTFFWGNNGSFTYSGDYHNAYYGAHPYPDPSNKGDGKWEISIRANDITRRDDGSSPYIEMDEWYNQAYLARDEDGGNFSNRFYTDLPSLSSQDRITVSINDQAHPAVPPNPAIVVGQSPDECGPPPSICNASWGGYSRWEEQNAIIRGLQFYNTALTEEQILALSNAETDTEVLTLCDSLGISAPWYLNMNPTPTDVEDKSGNGHHPEWDGSGRPTLWSDGQVAVFGLHPGTPSAFNLESFAPNPFYAKTILGYWAGEALDVLISIYDQTGEVVRVFSQYAGQAGRYQVEWDGRDESGKILSNGMYMAGITINDQTFTKRVILLR